MSDIVGRANCGCHYHAEQGIPCEHDLDLLKFPVWGTQGGGIVRDAGAGRYTFIVAPERSTGLNVGDAMPGEWSLIPANRQAREEDGLWDPYL